MSNAFFHDIKFEIEDNYTLVEKSSVLELFEKRKSIPCLAVSEGVV